VSAEFHQRDKTLL